MRRLPPPPQLARRWRKAGTTGACYELSTGCTVLVAREPKDWRSLWIEKPIGPPYRWHLSIAHPDRYPTWDEVAAARFALLPDDICVAQLLPARYEAWVNLHPNCFHLWEIRDEAG